MDTERRITDRTVDDVAREADVDRRSVIRRLAGLQVKGKPGARIDRALASRGLLAALEGRTSP